MKITDVRTVLLTGPSTDDPYLRAAPSTLSPVDLAVPQLGPGESVQLEAPLTVPAGPRQVAWITLSDGGAITFADSGSPPLQLASAAP